MNKKTYTISNLVLSVYFSIGLGVQCNNDFLTRTVSCVTWLLYFYRVLS